MSREVDERVVSMQFDNKHFEENVKTSMSTLEKLKQSLKLKDASKGLENVSAAAKKFDMSSMGNAVDKVGLRFSALYTIADQTLRNITNSAEMYAKRIISAFTIDPVKTGLQEYETQINSVQTILANVSQKGKTLDDVNAALDDLNLYADKTIYNFTEMTRNIGLFVNAGADLDTSVNAIKGFSNAAAMAGTDATKTAGAMYQLSQAMSSGSVRLMDWKSLEIANITGERFQETIKETARAHDIAIDDMIAKEGSLRETLKDGWLTADLMSEALGHYTLSLTEMSDEEIQANKTRLKSLGYTEKQIDKLFQLGTEATDAATKVKTFTQLMDTLKESAQSGWSQTWRTIIGDFEESKALFTKLLSGNIEEGGQFAGFGTIIDNWSKSRNDLLFDGLTNNWTKLIKQVNAAEVSTEEFEKALKDTINAEGYDYDELIEKHGSLEKIFTSGAVQSDVLKKAIGGLNKVFDGTSKRTNKELTYTVQKGDTLWSIAKKYNMTWREVWQLNKDIIKNPDLIFPGQVLKLGGETVEDTGKKIESYGEIIDNITKKGGRELLVESLFNGLTGLVQVFGSVGTAWRNVFPRITSEQLYGVIVKIHEFSQSLVLNEEKMSKLTRTFTGLFSVLKIAKTVVSGVATFGFRLLKNVLSGLGVDILDITAAVGDAITNFANWLNGDNKLIKWFDELGVKAGQKVGTFGKWIGEFFGQKEVKSIFGEMTDEFSQLYDVVTSDDFQEGLVDNFKESGKAASAWFERVKNLEGGFTLENIKFALKDFYDNVLGIFTKRDDGSSIFDGLINAFKKLRDKADEYLKAAGINLGEVGAKISNFFTSIKDWVSKNKGSIAAVSILIGMFALVYKVFKTIGSIKLLFNLSDLVDSLDGVMDGLKSSLKAQAVKSIAIAIGILAAALVVLAMLPVGKLWSAVGAMVVVAGMLVGSMILLDKFGGNPKDFANISGSLLMLAGSLLILSLAAKMFGELEPEVLVKAGAALVILYAGIRSIAKLMNGKTGDFVSFGKMMIALSASLIIMSVALKLFGKMDTDTLVKGGAGVIGCMAILTGFIWAISAIQKSTGQKEIMKFGGIMLSLSGALILMTSAIWLLSKMKWKTFLNGGAKAVACMTVLGLFIYGIAAIQKKTGQKKIAQISGMLLALGGALLIMTAVVAILGAMDTKHLVKGLIAVGFLSAFLGLLVFCSGLAKRAKVGPIVALSVAVGIMAAALVALTLVDTKKLLGAAASLGIVMAAFALMSKLGPSSLYGVLAISGLLLVLGGFAYLVIKNLPWIGEQLAGFMKEAQPFFDGVKGIDPSIVTSIGTLMAGLAKLTGIGMLDRWTGGGSVALITKELVPFIKELSEGLKYLDDTFTDADGNLTIDPTKLASIIDCLAALASIQMPLNYDVMFGVGGLKGWMGGFAYVNIKTEDAETFAKKIETLNAAFTTIATTLGITSGKTTFKQSHIDLIKSVIDCYAMLAGIQLPPEYDIGLGGGVVPLPVIGLVGGFIRVKTEDAENFGTKIDALNKAFTSIVGNISTTDKNGNTKLKFTDDQINIIKTVIDCYGVLAGLHLPYDISAVYKAKNLLGLFTKDVTIKQTDAETFGNNIKTLGDAFNTIVANISTEKDGKTSFKFTTAQVELIKSVIGCYADIAGLDLGYKITAAIGGLGGFKLGKIFGAVVGGGTIEPRTAEEFANTINELGKAFDSIVGKITTEGETSFKLDQAQLDLISSVITCYKDLAGIQLAGTYSGFVLAGAATKIKGLVGGVISGGTISVTDANTFSQNITTLGNAFSTIVNTITTETDGKTSFKFSDSQISLIESVIDCYGKIAGLQLPEEHREGTVGGAGGKIGPFIGLVGGWDISWTQDAAQFAETINALNTGFTSIVANLSDVKKDGTVGDLKFTQEQVNLINSVIAGYAVLCGLILPTEENSFSAGGGVAFGPGFGIVVGWDRTWTQNGEEFAQTISDLHAGFNSIVANLKGGDETYDFTQAEVDLINSVISGYNVLCQLKLPTEHESESTVDVDAIIVKVSSYKTEWTKSAEDFAKTISALSGAFQTIATSLKDEKGNFTITESELSLINSVIDSIQKLASIDLGTKEEMQLNIGEFLNWEIKPADIEDFSTKLVELSKGLHTFATAVTGENAIDSEVVGKAASILESLSTALKNIPDQGLFDKLLGSNQEQFATDLGKIAEGLTTFCTESPGDYTLGNTAITFLNSVIDLAKRLETECDGVFSLSALGDELNGLGSAIEEFYTSGIQNVDAAKLASVASALKDLASITVDSSGTLASFVEGLSKVGSDGVDAFLNAFSNAEVEALNAGASLLSNAVKGAKGEDETGGLKTAFSSMLTICLSYIRSKYEVFYSVGGYLVKGFAEGINDNTFLAVAKAMAMARMAIAAAQTTLAINSPSKVFRAIGMSVPEGFAMGIDMLSGMVVRSSENMAETAIDGAKSSLSRVVDAINSDIDAQPTIRPVLDLSEVRSGAGRINSLLGDRPSLQIRTNVNSVASSMNNRQNGNDQVVSAIENLSRTVGNTPSNTYQINGVTYDDGSNISEAVRTIVRAARIERRT